MSDESLVLVPTPTKETIEPINQDIDTQLEWLSRLPITSAQFADLLSTLGCKVTVDKEEYKEEERESELGPADFSYIETADGAIEIDDHAVCGQ